VPPRRALAAVAPPAPKAEPRGTQGAGRARQSRQASTRGGTGAQATSAGTGDISSYRARVVAHLTRYKNYPEQAQDRGITGANKVTITLLPDGRVASSALSGSGHSLLDSATQAALRRAQPFPPMPAGGPGTLTLTIVLNYRLQ
jgi:protein TonB